MTSLKLYSVSDSPPTLAVRMAIKYLDVEHELINIDYANGEQINEDYLEKNPQGEVPLVDDDGFLLSESVAILQYLADKYKKDDTFYPENAQDRAVVNHRLAFNLSTFYKSIAEYMMLPLCYAYERTELNLKKMTHAVKVFEDILKRQDKAYVAGDDLTIADLSMVMGCACLEAIAFDLSEFEKVQTWYDNFKEKHEDLWEVANEGLEELKGFVQNPPDLSHVNHPIHPTTRSQEDNANENENEAEAEAQNENENDNENENENENETEAQNENENENDEPEHDENAAAAEED